MILGPSCSAGYEIALERFYRSAVTAAGRCILVRGLVSFDTVTRLKVMGVALPE